MLRRAYHENLHRIALAMGLVVLLVAGFAAQRAVTHCRGMLATGEAAVSQESGTVPSCCRPATRDSDAATSRAQSCCAAGSCHCAEKSHVTGRSAGADVDPRDGDSIGAAGCGADCCVAVDVSVPTGPLPKAFDLDSHLPMVATFAPPAAHLPAITSTWLPPFATGPPRPDPHLALRRTTLLLI